jgi:hypothetical protein
VTQSLIIGWRQCGEFGSISDSSNHLSVDKVARQVKSRLRSSEVRKKCRKRSRERNVGQVVLNDGGRDAEPDKSPTPSWIPQHVPVEIRVSDGARGCSRLRCSHWLITVR